MQIRKYLEAGGAEKLHVIAIDWMESRYGASPDRLDRVLAALHPAIRVVTGSEATSRDFGGVALVPAIYVFDGKGRLVTSFGRADGVYRPVRVTAERIAEIVDGLR